MVSLGRGCSRSWGNHHPLKFIREVPERGTRCFALGDEVEIGHTLGSVITEVFSNLKDFTKPSSQTSGQSPQSQRKCPTAWPGRGSVSLLAISDVKVGSVAPFHKPRPIPCGCLGSLPVDSTRMPQGQESAHRKDFPAEKTQLYSAFITNWHSLPSTSRNFIRPCFSHISQAFAEASHKMH